MLDQPSFADLDYQHKRHKTRREQFLERLGALVSWSRLEARILPHYPKAGKGRRPYPLSVMLRVHVVQICHNLSDPAMEAPAKAGAGSVVRGGVGATFRGAASVGTHTRREHYSALLSPAGVAPIGAGTV